MAHLFHWRGYRACLWWDIHSFANLIQSFLYRTDTFDSDSLGRIDPAYGRGIAGCRHRNSTRYRTHIHRNGTALLGRHRRADRINHNGGGEPDSLPPRYSPSLAPWHGDRRHGFCQQLRFLHEFRHWPGTYHCFCGYLVRHSIL